MTEKIYNLTDSHVIKTLVIIATIQFLILSTISMLLYSGAESAARYNFWFDAMSALGMIGNNILSMLFFNISIIFLGIMYIYISFRHEFSSRCEKIASIISNSGLAAIGFSPFDLHKIPHAIFVYIWITTLMVLLTINVLTIKKDIKFITLFIYLVITILYFITMSLGIVYTSIIGFSIAIQKLVIYGMLVFYIMIFLGKLR